MLASLMYLFIALLVLGFLIFVHELGHYFMARKVGMHVEAFGIGFGRPIYRWMHDGCEWRLNWIPFGGYVKIKGENSEDETQDPYEVKDGFFGRPPLDRIKVSLAGPLANIVLAFVAFGFLWALGGRDKSFSEFSSRIGWVDPKSELFQDGIRPGDEITAYGERSFTSSKDHLYEALTADGPVEIHGERYDYLKGTHEPFNIHVSAYPHPRSLDKSFKTVGILDSASYLIFNPSPVGDELTQLMASGSPLNHSGIEANDRVIWANGEVIFSQPELAYLINEPRTLVTVDRQGQKLLRRVPRVAVQELKVGPSLRDDFADWQYEAGLQKVRVQKLNVIPYALTHDAVVEELIPYIDPEAQKEAFPEHPFSAAEEPLKVGDKIIALNGEPIKFAHDLLQQVQEPKVLLIVSRGGAGENDKVLWTKANQEFDHDINWEQLQQLISGIGVPGAATSLGNLYRLKAVTPKLHSEFVTTSEGHALYAARVREQRREAEALEDPERRAHALELLNKTEQQLHLGPPIFRDRTVIYNPGPLALFEGVFTEIVRTLKAFASGTLSPKWIAGPIGLVSVIQQNWAVSTKEGLFWLGAVSLNLGVLNLLPVPVLDGGTICFSLFELVTRRRIKIKTLEKLIVPFALLLIVFFLFLTYNDVTRILTSLFGW